MGGTQFKYYQISEFNFEFITKTDKVVFNNDFSILFMIQQSQIGFLLQIFQFKSGTMKIISKQRINENQVVSLLPYKNYQLFFKTCKQHGGIHLNSIVAQNNNKYLINLQINNRLDEISKNITCLIMNQKENLIVSGGCIFNGQKRANLEFWTFQNGWRMVQNITNSDIDDSKIKKLCFNESETKIIATVRIKFQYYIIIYHYVSSNQFWVEQSKLEMPILKQSQLINDNILVVSQKKIKSNILGNCSLKAVLKSYVLNQQNKQFVFKMEIDDLDRVAFTEFKNLVYSPNKKILVSIRQGFLKFMKIKDDGRISVQQIINLEFNYDYLSISQDLKYLLTCEKQLMKIFELNEI